MTTEKKVWQCYHCDTVFKTEDEAKGHVLTCEKSTVLKELEAAREEIAQLEAELRQAHEDNDVLNYTYARELANSRSNAACAEFWSKEFEKLLRNITQRSRARMAHDAPYAAFVRAIRRSYGKAGEGEALSGIEIRRLAEDESLDIAKLVAVALEFGCELKFDLKEKTGTAYTFKKKDDGWTEVKDE